MNGNPTPGPDAGSFLSMSNIAGSDLVRLSFDLREAGISVETATGLVGWAISEFAMGRCAYLAAAVCKASSREHFVSFVHPDGRMAHAAVAMSPQIKDSPLAGNGADILGRRPLRTIESEVRALCGPVRIIVGCLPDDLDPLEEKALLDFAGGLPWFRGLAGRNDDLVASAEALGFRPGQPLKDGPGS